MAAPNMTNNGRTKGQSMKNKNKEHRQSPDNHHPTVGEVARRAGILSLHRHCRLA
jgi:hypothetical protein